MLAERLAAESGEPGLTYGDPPSGAAALPEPAWHIMKNISCQQVITLVAADEAEVVRGCWPKQHPITQIVFLHGRIIYHDAPSR